MKTKTNLKAGDDNSCPVIKGKTLVGKEYVAGTYLVCVYRDNK